MYIFQLYILFSRNRLDRRIGGGLFAETPIAKGRPSFKNRRTLGFFGGRTSGDDHAIEMVQRLRYRAGRGIVNTRWIRETHLVFGRMNVDIHLIVGNAQKQDRHRKLPFHQALRVTGKKGVLGGPVPYIPTVDEYENTPRSAS